jgi:hypothetical protein
VNLWGLCATALAGLLLAIAGHWIVRRLTQRAPPGRRVRDRLHEDALRSELRAFGDRRLARIVNVDLTEYRVPVNADLPAIDVIMIDVVSAQAEVSRTSAASLLSQTHLSPAASSTTRAPPATLSPRTGAARTLARRTRTGRRASRRGVRECARDRARSKGVRNVL